MAAKREAVRQLPRLWCLKSLLGLAEVTPQKTEPAMVHLSTAHASGTPAPFLQPPNNLHINLDHPYLRQTPLHASADTVATFPGMLLLPCQTTSKPSSQTQVDIAHWLPDTVFIRSCSTAELLTEFCRAPIVATTAALSHGVSLGAGQSKPPKQALGEDDVAIRLAAEKRAAAALAASAFGALARTFPPALSPGWEIPVNVIAMQQPAAGCLPLPLISRLLAPYRKLSWDPKSATHPCSEQRPLLGFDCP